MKLDGRVAVITGAGRGIGRAIALAFTREGARLALAARNEPELEEAVREVSELGGEAIAIRTDVTSQIGTERLARRTVEHFGRIDVLVNNAGISGPVGPLQDNDIGEWVDTINVNLTGTFLVCRAVVPVMIEQGGGRIINLSGAGVANAWSNMSAYCSSKAAVVRLTEVLAQELEGKGITVNALGPGSVHTSMWEKMTEQAADAGAEFIHELGQRVLSGGGASIDDRRLRRAGGMAGIGRERSADGQNHIGGSRRFSQSVSANPPDHGGRRLHPAGGQVVTIIG